MVGSVTIVIPVNFIKSGLILSIIIMTVIGLVSYKTCSWVVSHAKNSEKDMSEIIKRVLGDKWFKIFCFGSSLLMFCIGVVFFLLLNNTVYPMIEFVCDKIKGCHI
jgi:sodium-coupled neutral amino acid transporter 9